MSTGSDSAVNPAHSRAVVQQGALIKVMPAHRRKHAGGGRRGKQRGHTRRSELRLHDYLSTCHSPDIVIWLTYPDVMGPGNVEKNVKAFLGRLERRFDRKFGAIAKMETQKRLAPELGILLWNLGDAQLDTVVVENLWSKTIKASGKVTVEAPQDWLKLASYVSKQVVVTDSMIIIGANRHYFATQEPEDSILVKRAHNQEIPEHSDPHTPFSNPYLTPSSSVSMSNYQVRREWTEYTGRFYWKRNEKLIPRHPKQVMNGSEEQVDRIRGRINAKRINHFVRGEDSMTIRGVDALKVVRELGSASDVCAKVAPELERLSNQSNPLTSSHEPRFFQGPVYLPYIDEKYLALENEREGNDFSLLQSSSSVLYVGNTAENTVPILRLSYPSQPSGFVRQSMENCLSDRALRPQSGMIPQLCLPDIPTCHTLSR